MESDEMRRGFRGKFQTLFQASRSSQGVGFHEQIEHVGENRLLGTIDVLYLRCVVKAK
jgi:hypothetical protein